MDKNEARRKIAALKSIIQTVIADMYWSENEGGARAFFSEMSNDEDPVTVAIRNELTEDEIDLALSWSERAKESFEQEMSVMPVVAHLTPEQIHRTRVRSVSLDEADKAFEFARETLGGPGKVTLSAEDRVRIGERGLMLGMIEDMVRERGDEVALSGEGISGREVEELPEPWRTHAKRRLAELRTRLSQGTGEDDVV